MSNSSSGLTDSVRRWAYAQLKVPLGTGRDEAQSAMLRAVSGAQGVPDPAAFAAWQILAADVSPSEESVPPDAQRSFAAALEADVEQFASTFFDLPPTERNDRWRALYDRCVELGPDAPRASAMAAWLNALQPALAIDTTDSPRAGDEYVLATEILKIFVQRPDCQGWLRRNWLHSVHPEAKRWRVAAKQLIRSHSHIAALGPGFVKHFAAWRVPALYRRTVTAARHRALITNKPKERSRSAKWAWPLVVIAIGALRAGCNLDSSRSPTSPLPSDSRRQEEIRAIRKAVEGMKNAQSPARTPDEALGLPPGVRGREAIQRLVDGTKSVPNGERRPPLSAPDLPRLQRED